MPNYHFWLNNIYSCAVLLFTVYCSILFPYSFQDGLKKSHLENMMFSCITHLTHLMDSVLKSPTGFWTITCLSELNFQTFQSPKNFGLRPCKL